MSSKTKPLPSSESNSRKEAPAKAPIDNGQRLLRNHHSLFRFMLALAGKKQERGRTRTSETYLTALRSFSNFRGGKDISLLLIRPDTMEGYEAWLKDRGITRNTVSFYMRILRAAYNRASEELGFPNRQPFRHVYTGVDKTVKRALSLEIIRSIKNLELDAEPHLDYARDMFMLSFYLRGMSLIDMAFLKKSDLRNGCLTYRRRKTGRRMSIAWREEMERIVEKHGPVPSGRLLPIIRKEKGEPNKAYRNAGYNINRNLKEIGRLAGVKLPLTLYAARHSWATAAKAKGIPLNVISEGMGHESEKTTLIYLSSLEASAVDSANDLILASLHSKAFGKKRKH